MGAFETAREREREGWKRKTALELLGPVIDQKRASVRPAASRNIGTDGRTDEVARRDPGVQSAIMIYDVAAERESENGRDGRGRDSLRSAGLPRP